MERPCACPWRVRKRASPPCGHPRDRTLVVGTPWIPRLPFTNAECAKPDATSRPGDSFSAFVRCLRCTEELLAGSTYPLDDLRPPRHALRKVSVGLTYARASLSASTHGDPKHAQEPYRAWGEAPGDPRGSTRCLAPVRSALTKYVPIALLAASWVAIVRSTGRLRAGLQRSPVPSQYPGTHRRMAATTTGRRWIVRAYTVCDTNARSPECKAQHPSNHTQERNLLGQAGRCRPDGFAPA
jgi:hypothetical protein